MFNIYKHYMIFFISIFLFILNVSKTLVKSIFHIHTYKFINSTISSPKKIVSITPIWICSLAENIISILSKVFITDKPQELLFVQRIFKYVLHLWAINFQNIFYSHLFWDRVLHGIHRQTLTQSNCYKKNLFWI